MKWRPSMVKAGHEPLYLKPGMDQVDLFQQFNARNPYYRVIASRLYQLAIDVIEIDAEYGYRVCDLLARTGYATWAALPSHPETFVTIVEHRLLFAEFLEGEFAAEREAGKVILSRENILDPDTQLSSITKFDIVLCCEQASLILPKYRNVINRLATNVEDEFVFAFSLGPSNHAFTEFSIADYRSGAVNYGEVMSELSHPIRQAVHAEVVALAKRHFNFERDDAWPPAGQAIAFDEIVNANEELGFLTRVVEDKFTVPGHQIHLFDQNGWTFYMRWPPLSELSGRQKIDLLKTAIRNVRKRKEYDEWCSITAYHPVAYYLLSRPDYY